ncbi:MAG: hypothetical protein RLZZ301_1250 [Bacteroidota bacterium]|jgi:uncharacterized membrane protein
MLTKSEQHEVAKAIEAAELQTSGEIRVHLEAKCASDPTARAIALFSKLKMQKTAARNGVLIYIAYQDKKFAIIGDQGIHEKVTDQFWNSTRDAMLQAFQQKGVLAGILAAVHESGQQLKTHFPHQRNDQNELSNEISIG